MTKPIWITQLLFICFLLLSTALVLNPISSKASEPVLLTPPANEGEAMFKVICGAMCHEAPEPGRLNKKQWPIVLDTMQQRMKQRNIEPLSDLNRKKILEYLIANAK